MCLQLYEHSSCGLALVSILKSQAIVYITFKSEYEDVLNENHKKLFILILINFKYGFNNFFHYLPKM